MNTPIHPSALSQARIRLLNIDARPAGTTSFRSVADFMSSLYEMGLVYADDHGFRATPELSSFVDETSPTLIKDCVALFSYPGYLLQAYQKSWEYDEWEQLCRQRSGLQYFFDLYRASDFGPFVQEIDTRELDEQMHEWGSREGFLPEEKIDPRLPQSHWWWRLPDQG
ncbi:hypothetical protein GCM10007862_08640 [Dyella lipolytica]|uniref:Uncharacterized protein n=1 Tax=Dyella lipolytica TaxID=1867835 RepID=A0ABW8IY59_9GAMM|nr:hypothetical protein [Dyella lipolytica]GLQ45813.1 hypothetical protein GCM10007862_08640 [Dyella lipolytica]